jgi:hypothetical protein
VGWAAESWWCEGLWRAGGIRTRDLSEKQKAALRRPSPGMRCKEGKRMGNLSLTWQPPADPACVLCSSIPAFKGLESAAVILTELDRMRPEVRDEQLYVGTSRARSHLVILGPLPTAEAEV